MHLLALKLWAFLQIAMPDFPTLSYIECFHMTSRRPYWCPKTMKRRPCWCPKPVLWDFNSFLMQTLPFVPINLHRCWPREWKHSILQLVKSLPFYIQSNPALHLIIMDSLLCPWGKKVLTFSLNPTHLIRTLSMAPSVLGINGVWLYLKPEKDTPVGWSLPV